MTSTQRRALRNRVLDNVYETVALEMGDTFAQAVVDDLDFAVERAIKDADRAQDNEGGGQ